MHARCMALYAKKHGAFLVIYDTHDIIPYKRHSRLPEVFVCSHSCPLNNCRPWRYVLVQWRAQKCMKHVSDVRSHSRPTKTTLIRQFSTSDEHEMTKQLLGEWTNSRFATGLDVRWARNDEKVVSRRGPPNSPRAKKIPNRSSLFSAAIFSRHLAVVRACMVSHWTSSCCGEGLVVGYWTSSSCGHLRQRSLKEPFATLFSAAIFSHHLAVVRPWSAIEHHVLVAIYDSVLWKNPLLPFRAKTKP